MSIIIKKDDFVRENPSPGMHQAVCSGVVDLGMQEFKGKYSRKVGLCFEINQRFTGEGEYKGKRMVVGKDYFASFYETSELRKNIESWFSRQLTAEELEQYDIETLAGKNCQLNLISKMSKKGKEFFAIANILPANPSVPTMTIETPGYIPQWMKDKMPADTQVAPQTQQKPQMTREGFDAAVDKIILLPVTEQTAAFDILRSNMNKAKLEGRCSEALFTECKLNWEMSSGRKFEVVKDFDDCDLF
jgi:hypothetical protein